MSGIQYEILCFDDSSTDDSYERLEKLSKTNDKIKVLKNDKNYGLSYTRNRLIKEATGKYIWFVDPDDIVRNVVSVFYNEAEKMQCLAIIKEYRNPIRLKKKIAYQEFLEKSE